MRYHINADHAFERVTRICRSSKFIAIDYAKQSAVPCIYMCNAAKRIFYNMARPDRIIVVFSQPPVGCAVSFKTTLDAAAVLHAVHDQLSLIQNPDDVYQFLMRTQYLECDVGGRYAVYRVTQQGKIPSNSRSPITVLAIAQFGA